MKRQETIAVDIDDVAAAENEGVRQFMNREYGYTHTPEDYLVEGEYWGYWENILGVSPEEWERMYEAFIKSRDKADLKVVNGAIEAIDQLKQKYNLVVVTSRKGSAIDITEPWLERHFPKTFRQIEFVATWSQNREINKAIICKEIGADYLIDDNVEHCNLAAEAGIRSLLFGDYGWNRRAKLLSGVVRVQNWQEVLEFFDAR